MTMREVIAMKLSTLSIEYGTAHSDADLALLADDWARELAEETPESVAAALDQHRRECSRFPTLADVLKLLPRCRVTPTRKALPESSPGKDWASRPRLIRDALRGDVDARAKVDALIQQAGGGRAC